MRTLCCTFALFPALAFAEADPFSNAENSSNSDFLYSQVAQKADEALQQGGTDAAIEVYEEALLEHGSDGRFHLRLGELYLKRGQMADAAFHFAECDRDEQIDALDRELICQAGFTQTTARLVIASLPPGSKVTLLEPDSFSGPWEAGQRVPKGTIKLAVEAPGFQPRSSELIIQEDLVWQAALGEPIIQSPALNTAQVTTSFEAEPIENTSFFSKVKWPAWVGLGLGAALVGGGLAVGFSNQNELDDIRERQSSGRCNGFCHDDLETAHQRAKIADGLWIGGAILAGLSSAWIIASGLSSNEATP